jgi:hypothetical protein
MAGGSLISISSWFGAHQSIRARRTVIGGGSEDDANPPVRAPIVVRARRGSLAYDGSRCFSKQRLSGESR